MNIAYFSPLPPQRSGISDYSKELLPHLAELVDLTVFTANLEEGAQVVPTGVKVCAIEQYAARTDDFDLAVYHIGNSEFHSEISRLAMTYPGVVVLHDAFLHHSVALRTLGEGNQLAYMREMGFELGAEGVRRAMAVEQGEPPPVFAVPLIGRMLATSFGVIVHSQYGASKVRSSGYKGPVAVIPALVTPFSGRSRRAELDLPQNAVLFASFGLITREKQIDAVLRTLHRLRAELPEARYLLVGDALADVPVSEMIRALELGDVVHHIGYVPKLEDFVDWIHTADVVVNLRSPTLGETSATALRAMAAGRPIIASDLGWYSEIPADAAIKIQPGNEIELEDAMRRFAQSPALRGKMGMASRSYTRRACSPTAVAKAYSQMLREILNAVETYG